MFSRIRRSVDRGKGEASTEEPLAPDHATEFEYDEISDSPDRPPIQPLRSISEPSTYTILAPQPREPDLGRSNSTATFNSTLSGGNGSNSGSNTDPLGLTVVHDPPDAVGDLIFVHGLGGSSRRTWSWQRKPENFWPAWLLNERGLPPMRILTFGYNANYMGQSTPINILDFSKDLLNRMRGFCDGSADSNGAIGQKPIMFIAHSMGGLVVKKAYVIGKSDMGFADMLSAVFGIMFLSTPHKGSAHASVLNNVLAATLAMSSKAYVSDLSKDSTFIQNLNEEFRGCCDGLQLVSIYETLTTKLGPFNRMIVGKDSGILGYPKELSSPMNADHHTVCKFPSSEDDGYSLVTAMIKRMTEHLESQWSSRRPSEGSLSTFKKLEDILGVSDDPHEDLAQVTAQGLSGTGFWLRDRTNFRDWTAPLYTGPNIYWLSGLPGTGKTILAGITTEHLHRRFLPRSTQCFFFVNAQPSKRSVANCLLSIAYQLATTNPAFAVPVMRLHDETGMSLTSFKYQTIWKTLFEDTILRIDPGYTLYWILDAIDECEDPVAMMKLFLKIPLSRRIRVLITGRPNKELANLASSHPEHIQQDMISTTDTKDEIATYVRTMVQETLPRDSKVRESIICQLLQKAEGSFLWAKLALHMLKASCHTQDDIHEALNHVPKDMESLYSNIIEQIRKQPAKVERVAMRILTWAACSFRPMKIKELETALRPEFGDFIKLEDTIVEICGHFVRLDNGTLTLIHATARRFLLNSLHGRIPVLSYREGHEMITSVCFQYLSSDRWRRLIARIQDTASSSSKMDRLLPIYEADPFLRYAKDYWAYHLSHASVDSKELLKRAQTFFEKYALCWIQAVAFSNRLKTLTQTAQFIKIFLRRRRAKIASDPPTSLKSADRTKVENSALFLERWAVDLIRLVGKFGADLSRSPITIHRHIPPLCPRDSIIHETYAYGDEPVIAVEGLSSGGWDDNLARIGAGQDQTVSKVLATGMYFVTLTASSGTMVVWLAETFEEHRKLEHKEWVLLMEINSKGNRLLSVGRFTFKIWDVASGALLWSQPKESQARPMAVRFGDGDTSFIVGYDDCSVVHYDIERRDATQRFLAEEKDDVDQSCPRLMVLSPDNRRLVTASRGRPVVLWDLEAGEDQVPLRCIRSEDQDRWDKEEGEVWNAPEVVRWHPDGSSLFVLYQDATIVDWRFLDEQQFEHGHTKAREMVINPDGTFLLTSDRDGSLSVWTLAKMNLLYRLHYEEFVRDLAFSPDGQRIYDTRGSRCNIWEPDVLVRPDDFDKEEGSSSCDGSLVSEPVISQDDNQRSQITSLACEDTDHFYCCGKDDGTVILHRMTDGTKIKKLCSHANTVAVILLGWSPSAKYIVSADDSGKVISKRLKIKDDGNWAVFAVFEFRIDETVDQILFNPDESLVLISTASNDYVWNLKTKKQVCAKPWKSRSGRRWINHPNDTEYLVWVDPDDVHIHAWSDMRRISSRAASIIDTIVEVDETDHSAMPPALPIAFGRPHEYQETVQALAQTADRKHIICEILPDAGQNRSNSTDALRLDLVFAADLDIHKFDPVRRKHLATLAGDVQRLLGCYRDKLIFLNHANWLCSYDVEASTETVKQHYVIPRDWLTSSAPQLITLNKQGTLLCPRNGEVALVRYKNRL